jgi:IclR family acetate operon transcriptional repressor
MANKYNVNSVSKALAIVELLSRSAPKGLTMPEMEGPLKIKKSTLFVLLATLVNESLLTFNETTRQYCLGLKLFEWGSAAAKGLELKAPAFPFLEALTESTRETSHLAVLDNAEVMFIEKVESPEPLKMSSSVGARFPLHAPATAKVLFAFQEKAAQKKLLDKMTFRGFTKNTIRSRKEYLKEIEKTARLGYAVDNEEILAGTRCIAGRVFDRYNKICTAVGITAPANRLTRDRIPETAEKVMKTAKALSQALGATEFNFPKKSA